MEIDGVFSGGGMKGYALIGALQILEKKGYKFRRLAGTSAGAIVVSLMAAGFSSSDMYNIFMGAPRKKFMDAGFRSFPFWKWLSLYWSMGLYKGEYFEKWLAEKLAEKNVFTFRDLPENKLKIVVSDLTSNELIVIPDDLSIYGVNPLSFSVASAVRMSISIPYIFRPVKFKDHIFVDGGVLSNFPMWVLTDIDNKSDVPVLGIKLTPKIKEVSNDPISNCLELYGSLFETMMTAHDQRYISRKFQNDIMFIPIKEGISKNFHMSNEKCELLVDSGRQEAEKFLKAWKPKIVT